MPHNRILLTREPEGGFTVVVPKLPGCITYGENMDEALDMAEDGIELYQESLIAHGEWIPNEDNTFEYSTSLVAWAKADLHIIPGKLSA